MQKLAIQQPFPSKDLLIGSTKSRRPNRPQTITWPRHSLAVRQEVPSQLHNLAIHYQRDLSMSACQQTYTAASVRLRKRITR